MYPGLYAAVFRGDMARGDDPQRSCNDNWLHSLQSRPQCSGLWQKSRRRSCDICQSSPWCTDTQVISQSCSEDVEYINLKCRPLFLPRELQCIILSVVYVPPSANEERALSELHYMISGHENMYPDSAVIALGDFTVI